MYTQPVFSICICIVALLAACAGRVPEPNHRGGDLAIAAQAGAKRHSTRVVDLRKLADLDDIIGVLASRRVVFVGENHVRFEHHQNQLEIIRRLHAAHGANLAIGMEFFQQPFQQHLDEYVAGKTSERELLTRTEYFHRWRYDFRLYQPILRFARQHRIPVIALNVPSEIVKRVSDVGIEGLAHEERGHIPRIIDRSDTDYLQRLRTTFENHPETSKKDFETFVDVQLLWDEGMAKAAADYLVQNPRRKMVLLAGNGHLAFGSGIPRRLHRRTGASSVILLNGGENGLNPDIADYVLLPEEQALPAPGRLGILLEDGDKGVHITSFAGGSAAKDGGLKEGDSVVAINGQAIRTLADIRVAMWDKRPGDRIAVRVRRDGWLSKPEEISLEVVLR